MNAAARAAQSGLLFLECMRERRVPYYSLGKIREIQTRRLRSIVKYAFENVPYYREVMRARSLVPEDIGDAGDLHRLPVISKANVRADATAFQSRLVPMDQCVLLKSTYGGTSYWDPHSSFYRMALHERDRVVWTRLALLRPGHTRLVVIPKTSSVHAQQKFLSARMMVPKLWARRVYHDSTQPFGALVETLERVRPEIVFSYGSCMEHFFRSLRGNGIRPAFLPRLWYYSSDGVDPGWREIIEREYGVIVYSTYTATEMPRIGYECEKRGAFHLNIDALAIRTVDHDGHDVPPGQTGEFCMSNLLNRGMVLLNYRIDDYGYLSSTRCECGRNLPVLGKFEGKVSRFMKLADGREILAPSVLRTFLPELVPALKFQLVVEGAGVVTLRVVLAPRASASEVTAAILRKAREEYGDNLQVTVEVVQDIDTGGAVKFPRIVNGDGADLHRMTRGEDA